MRCIMPFLDLLKPDIDPGKMKHAAYADEIGGGSKLAMLKKWGDKPEEYGPSTGYQGIKIMAHSEDGKDGGS